jgi:hypothetical protein
MSFMPCMFIINELQRFDGEEFLSFWQSKGKPQPVVFFKQPGSLVSFQQTYGAHYDSYSLPSVLPPMSSLDDRE